MSSKKIGIFMAAIIFSLVSCVEVMGYSYSSVIDTGSHSTTTIILKKGADLTGNEVTQIERCVLKLQSKLSKRAYINTGICDDTIEIILLPEGYSGGTGDPEIQVMVNNFVKGLMKSSFCNELMINISTL